MLLTGEGGKGGPQSVWNHWSLSGSRIVMGWISVSLCSVTARWDSMALPGHSVVLEMAAITQGLIHLCSLKVILQCVSFAARVLLTLMLSETQWLWTKQFVCTCKIYAICSGYAVHLLIWSRQMWKEVHKIGPIEKSSVPKVFLKLKCNLSISVLL